MLEVIDSDYVKTAKSKGLSQFNIILNHQLRNALVPIVTVLGPTAAYLVTGTFVVEQIFAIPGLGRHYVLAIQNLDYSLVMGLTIFFRSDFGWIELFSRYGLWHHRSKNEGITHDKRRIIYACWKR